MCGRYTLFKLEQLLLQFPWLQLPPEVRPRYNIAPTQPVLALANNAPSQLHYFHWGMIPSWAKDKSIGSRMINARGETLAERPAFRMALQRRRCLIPADGFYEWRKEADGGKTPMYIRMRDSAVFMFAGLWDEWHGPAGEMIRSCTVITTSPNDMVSPIHDRMPVIIPPDQFDRWLRGPDPAGLLKACPGESMECHPVSRLVNNPRNDANECVDSVAAL